MIISRISSTTCCTCTWTICVALHFVIPGGRTSSPDFATAVAAVLAVPLALDQEDPGNSASLTWRHWRVDNLLLGALGKALRRNDLNQLKGLIRDLRHWQVVLLHNPLSNGLDHRIFAAICRTGTSTMYSASASSTDANPLPLHPFPCYPSTAYLLYLVTIFTQPSFYPSYTFYRITFCIRPICCDRYHVARLRRVMVSHPRPPHRSGHTCTVWCPAGTHPCAAESRMTLQSERQLVRSCVALRPWCRCVVDLRSVWEVSNYVARLQDEPLCNLSTWSEMRKKPSVFQSRRSGLSQGQEQN